MFPQFGATAETLSKASSMVFRIGTDAHLYDDPDDASIAPLLDSKFDSEKTEALKRLLALIAQGFDVSAFFPQVVKNVATQSLEVKKLVYLYLLHYAEKRPNEALLSINCFQKDLGDPNPLVRAWALRTMAGIRLHVIAPIVLVAVGKCARDPSVYVRKCVANALPKLHDLRLEENTPSIEEIIGILLNDHSPGVVGAAAAAFASVCPNNLSLIGKHVRRLCEILPDVEEWGQIILTGILLRYSVAKHGLVRESVIFALRHAENNYSRENVSESMGWSCESKLGPMISECYTERPDEYLSRSTSMNDVSSESKGDCYYTSARTNEDVKILLKCTSPLLWSHNSAVLLAAAGVHWILAPMEDVKRIVKPLLFVLRSCSASSYVVLCNIQVFAKAMPSLFAPYFEDFFVCSSDSYHIRALKLDILSSIVTETSMSLVFKEFQDYIKDPDRRFASDTIAAMGICVQRLPSTSKPCLEGLLALVRQEFFSTDFASIDGEAGVLIQAISSIKSIIRPDPLSHEKVIVELVRGLDSIKISAARAAIVWMIGEYNSLGELIPRMLSTTLKYLAWCFPSEALEPKLQILNTTVKVLLSDKGEDKKTPKKVLSYLFELAKSDMSYDVRDRACFLEKLVSPYLNSGDVKVEDSVLKINEQSCVIAKSLFGGQTLPVPLETKSQRIYLPGSLSLMVLHAAPGYEPLPKPYSLIPETSASEDQATSGSSVTDDEETASQHSSCSSGSNDETENDDADPPLIQLSESGNSHPLQKSETADFEELMSKRAFESWLDEQPSLPSVNTSEPSPVRGTSARISMGDIAGNIKRKSHELLSPVNGNGLKVDYCFSPDISSISPMLVCLEASFCNCSTVPLSGISLIDEESSKASDNADTNESSVMSRNEVPTFLSMEEIASLEPNQAITRILQVRFNHHLLPVKLVLRCNGTTHPVKLWPDIGYFIKALPMDIEDLINRESQLKGMFEYTRSCSFSDHVGDKGDTSAAADKFLEICRSLALKMLSNANLFLVSVDLPVTSDLDDASGLCLRFSGHILSSSKPCLITVTVQGKCYEPLTVTVKVNCEETVFGLNLLNRVVNFLVEPSPTQ